MKPELTPLERITVAFGHYVKGIPQDDLATLMNVNNGRVNEACLAIMKAANDPKKFRKYGEKRYAGARRGRAAARNPKLGSRVSRDRRR